MRYRQNRVLTLATLFVIVAVMQTYMGVSFAARASAITALVPAVQGVSGILTTAGNKPITVNGASAGSGTTILSGATVETPDQVTASINVPGHGLIQIAANTRFTLEIDGTGNLKVNLLQGCVTLHTMKGTLGEVDNAQGTIGKTDVSKNDVVETCRGVKTAGAAAAGAGGLFGLGTAATVAIIAGGAGAGIGIALANRGANSSPSAP